LKPAKPARPLATARRQKLGIGFAIVSLAFAACGHSGSTPSASASASPTASSSATPSSLTSPCAANFGQAYEPDNGNGGGLYGIQVGSFQDTDGFLCASAPSRPQVVVLQAPVGGLAFAANQGSGLSTAVALLLGSGGYRYVQAIFGANLGDLVPAGLPYDLAMQPTPLPSTTPNPTSTAATIADASSASIIGTFSGSLALFTGPNAPAIVALTSLADAPPQYGSAIPYNGSSYTIPIPPDNYSIIQTTANSSLALVRGVNHLVSFGITVVATGFQFNAEAQDPNLGFGSPGLRGRGAIAMGTTDTTRALIGKGNIVTLVTGLPTAITETARIAVPGTTIRSIQFSSTGTTAAVATDAGLVFIAGVNGTSLSLVPAFTTTTTTYANQLPFINCAGQPTTLSNVYGVGYSANFIPGSSNQYIVALGTSNPPPTTGNVPCAYTGSVVAIPINPSTGTTPSPGPAATASPGASPTPGRFTQNNMILPPTGFDDFNVH
jgi:hypothetical protein